MYRDMKEKAVSLRKAGWSYSIISKRLGVAKSTLSHWLREISFLPNEKVKKRINSNSMRLALANHQSRIRQIKAIKKISKSELGKLSKRDLQMLGIGLYIGEGSKLYENIRIIDSDPNTIKLAMVWFRKILRLKDKNFRISIHIYPDTDKIKAMRFWSKITGVSTKQFGKTQIDKRENKSYKKRRKLPFGTAHITIKACSDKTKGVMMHRKIMGWIEGVYEQNG